MVNKQRVTALSGAALLAVGIGGILGGRPGEAAGKSGIQWRSSYTKAQAEAKKSSKPVLLEFYADWCGPCKMMEGSTFKDAAVAATTRKMVPVRVNVDEHPELASKYKVSGIPQSFVLSSGGKVVTGATGYMEAAEYRRFLMSGIAKAGK